jgi:hypothetical protein
MVDSTPPATALEASASSQAPAPLGHAPAGAPLTCSTGTGPQGSRSSTGAHADAAGEAKPPAGSGEGAIYLCRRTFWGWMRHNYTKWEKVKQPELVYSKGEPVQAYRLCQERHCRDCGYIQRATV